MGRPPGAKNKAPVVLDLKKAVSTEIPERQRLPDMGEMIADQLRIIKGAQAQIALNLAAGTASVKAISDLSSALARAMDAVSRASRAQDTIMARLSQAEHVEAAIRRLEDQEPGVIRYAMRRLTRASVGEIEQRAAATASAAIAELGSDE